MFAPPPVPAVCALILSIGVEDCCPWLNPCFLSCDVKVCPLYETIPCSYPSPFCWLALDKDILCPRSPRLISPPKAATVVICFCIFSIIYPSTLNWKIRVFLGLIFVILPFISTSLLGIIIKLIYWLFSLLPKNVYK
jgi:hypothetical protein